MRLRKYSHLQTGEVVLSNISIEHARRCPRKTRLSRLCNARDADEDPSDGGNIEPESHPGGRETHVTLTIMRCVEGVSTDCLGLCRWECSGGTLHFPSTTKRVPPTRLDGRWKISRGRGGGMVPS